MHAMPTSLTSPFTINHNHNITPTEPSLGSKLRQEGFFHGNTLIEAQSRANSTPTPSLPLLACGSGGGSGSSGGGRGGRGGGRQGEGVMAVRRLRASNGSAKQASKRSVHVPSFSQSRRGRRHQNGGRQGGGRRDENNENMAAQDAWEAAAQDAWDAGT